MRERINIRKAANYAIVLNAIQIVGALALLGFLLFDYGFQSHAWSIRAAMIGLVALVCGGAALDIHESREAVRVQEQALALQRAYEQLEALNQTLRAQRHDFMNHLQVVSSLVELNQSADALDYIDQVNGDLQRVSRAMRTANPAVNALLQAKLADCEKRGVEVTLSITAKWDELPMPGWEMCRVLGNLIDNSLDALQGCKNPALCIVLFEDGNGYRFRVENNGEQIPADLLPRVFTAGFTTKEHGQGLGLHIVRSVLEQYNGEISVRSNEKRTVFEGFLPRTTDARPI